MININTMTLSMVIFFIVFSLMIGLGVLIGLAWSVAGLPDSRSKRAVDFNLGILLGCLVTSRLFYVVIHWSYFRTNLVEVPQVWMGGLSGVGGIWGGLFALWIILAFSRQSYMDLADRLIYLGGSITLAAWVACWFLGWAYGPASNGAWWGIPSLDEWGIFAPRFPTQLLGAGLVLLLLRLLDILQKKKRRLKPGMIAALALSGLSFELLALSFLRADPSIHLYNVRLDTWGAISLVMISLIQLAWLKNPFKGL